MVSDIMDGWILTTGIDYKDLAILLYYCNSVASYVPGGMYVQLT